MSHNDTSTCYAGTPEAYLEMAKGKRGTDAADAIGCALARAQATVTLLSVHLEDNESRVSDRVLADALWAIEGYLDQLKILTLNSDIKPKEGE